MSVSWMLLKKSGRQSVVRLGLTAAAVALGIMLAPTDCWVARTV